MFRLRHPLLQAAAAATATATVGRQPARKYVDPPFFSIYDVRETPEEGKMIRVTVTQKQSLMISYYPQLGPRKVDPNDPSPQFNINKRVAGVFRTEEIAKMLCVLEGRAEAAELMSRGHSLAFRKDGERTYSLRGVITPINMEPVPFSVEFHNDEVSRLRCFLEPSLLIAMRFRCP